LILKTLLHHGHCQIKRRFTIIKRITISNSEFVNGSSHNQSYETLPVRCVIYFVVSWWLLYFKCQTCISSKILENTWMILRIMRIVLVNYLKWVYDTQSLALKGREVVGYEQFLSIVYRERKNSLFKIRFK